MTSIHDDASGRHEPTLGDLARDRPARRYFPYVVVATALVAVVPVAVVWLLRADGDVTSPWICVLVAVALSLIAAALGSAAWKRRAAAGDLMFSELLVWGWVRRLRMERQFADALELIEHAESNDRTAEALSPEDRWHALGTLALVVEALDAYTIGHSRRVARHAAVIARKLGLPDEQVKTIGAAAAVHDVGKVFTPRAILNKPSTLTDMEYDAVKRHCEDGAAIVACLADPELTAIVRHHHERLDGTGYPAGLTGEQIPLGARIVAVADTYDAIIEIRPYRSPASHKHAIEVLLSEQGTHLDPAVVQAFLSGYAGRRALVVWTMLAVLPQRVFSFGSPGGGGAAGAQGAAGALRKPMSVGQRATTAAVGATLAAAAFAAGSTQLPKLTRQPPTPLPVVAQRTVDIRVHKRPHHRKPAPKRRVSSTCLAYNAQLCSVIYAGGRNVAGQTTSASGTAGGSTTGTLPFTGVDVGLLGALGLGLIGLGAGFRAATTTRRLRPVSGLRARGGPSARGSCCEPPSQPRAGSPGAARGRRRGPRSPG